MGRNIHLGIEPPDRGIEWIAVYNTETESAPAYCLLEIVDTDNDGIVQVCAPTEDGIDPARLLINGSADIPGQTNGAAHQARHAGVLYDTGDGTPAADEVWGSKANSWALAKGKNGFIIRGTAVAGSATVNVSRLGWNVVGVRITSLTKTGNFYPAKEVLYDPVSDTFTDGADCWYRDLNG